MTFFISEKVAWQILGPVLHPRDLSLSSDCLNSLPMRIGESLVTQHQLFLVIHLQFQRLFGIWYLH